MKKLLPLTAGVLLSISSAHAVDYRVSMDFAVPTANTGWQWSNFTKMSGVKWENAQPKAFPKKNDDGTLTYSMDGSFKKVAKGEGAYINVFGDKSKPTYFYVQQVTDIPEEKFFQKAITNLFNPSQLTEISSNCTISLNSGVPPQKFYRYNKTGYSPLFIAHQSSHMSGANYYNTNVFTSYNDMVKHANDKGNGMKYNNKGEDIASCNFKNS